MTTLPKTTYGSIHLRRFWWLLAISLLISVQGFVSAADPHALPPGQLPADKRLEPLKDLNGYFPFTPPKSKQEWERRADELRRQTLVSQGLLPMPTKTPLNQVIHGLIDQGEYTIEKAYFESFPGFYVTGSLYRPKNSKGKVPGVLCPHGHWANGRFYDIGENGIRQQIVQGAERFENGGRSPLQARCVQLARLGCVVFHYDMIGYADSVQISYELAHRFAKQRPEMNKSESWGLFSPQAESHLQSVMGMQTYNSTRALDFITSLSDVDPERIAVTGASGGGTQTFMISALDPRVRVSVPAVMVSTAMQGGCTCENSCLLRVGTGNVDFAALFAPKPICLTSADDWTKEMDTKGFPELQQHYRLLGAPSHAKLHSATHFKHNYNYVSRAAMYHWLNKHFHLGHEEPIVEEDFARLTPEELTVWDDEHPKPDGGEEFERGLLRWWHEDTQKQLTALAPKDKTSLDRYKDIVGGAIRALIGQGLPESDNIEFEQTATTDGDLCATVCGLLSNKQQGSQLPVVILRPKQAKGRAVIWLHRDGKSGLFEADGKPKSTIRRLLESGVTVVGVDLLYQGEFLADGKPIDKTRRVENTREAAAYTFCYNHTLFARRVHDVLTTISFVRTRKPTADQVDLVGIDGAGPWAAAARAVARDAVTRAAIDTAGFRFGDVSDIHSPDFLAGGARYHDLPGMLAVAAPGLLWLAGEGPEVPEVVAAAYKASGHAESLVTIGGQDEAGNAAVAWLIGK
ncbi:MAG: acetylxylan esterase [Pirellulaceae bacterium]|nr:acetylxylan esterase [Pirellulaceae bacterium]